ncbi:MAG: succinate dehydrogenase cytochrome b subunit [Crocinitomicaceae bacterium]|nr:succinate dehydrogenase cytochrome b subunit [Crocinitomicaceae bacterium]
MSKSALLKSSIAKKYWMALTGLFLCTFLIGHLIGNLQLIFMAGEEGRRAFNVYAYFMAHNPAIKILSYLTYFSILFHTIDGIMLTIKNKKSRPKGYAYNNAAANSSSSSRNMALLGSLILVFIVMHMANFWYKAKIDNSAPFPLHVYELELKQDGKKVRNDQTMYYFTHQPTLQPIPKNRKLVYRDTTNNITDLYIKGTNIKIAEGYKDLHSLVFAFFGQDKSKYGFPKNEQALYFTLFYIISMLVLSFHLWHGFASAFQSLGINHSSYNKLIKSSGKLFAVLIPLGFAIIPLMIFLNQI